jgi:hypothetical protein
MGKELRVLVGHEPQFPVQVPGMEAWRPNPVFYYWEHGRDLYVDVVGLSTLRPLLCRIAKTLCRGLWWRMLPPFEYLQALVAWYREVLVWQPRAAPPPIVFKLFAFDVFGGLLALADELLKRLQCLVSLASVAYEGLVWFSAHRRVGFAVAHAVGRQLASRLPWEGFGGGMLAVAGFS